MTRSGRPAFKVTEFVRRNRALHRDAFLRHWDSERAPLLLALRGLAGLTFNRVDPARSPNASWDGVVQMWFADEAAYRAAFDRGDAKLLRALADDWPRFAEGEPTGFASREVPVIERPAATVRGSAKRIGLVGRHPGTTEAAFFRDWRGHAREAADQPGLVEYWLNLRSSLRLPGTPWDGYAELWWRDWDAFEQARVAIRPALGKRLAFFDAHELLYVEEFVARDPQKP